MTWGSARSALFDQIEAQGDALPYAGVPAGLEWVWIAWHRLSADRAWFGGGMSAPVPAPIAWRDVLTWCDFHDLAGEDVAFLDACFQAMDAVFIEHMTKK